MNKIKAVVYDVDGTLVDSESLHVQAWDETLSTYEHTLDDLSEVFLRTMAGKKPLAIAEGMVNELKLPVSTQDFLDQKSKRFLALAQKELRAMPGAIDSVHTFKNAGYRLAIGTSLDRQYLDMILARFDLQNEFEVIVTGDQIKNGKPHPETYQKVIEKLGLMPRECVALEDTESGVASAKATNMYCIGIKNTQAAAQDLSAADTVVSSLREVGVTLIRSLSSLL